MPEVTTFGLDLAKSVFQVHGVDSSGHAVIRKKLRRDQVLAYFSQVPQLFEARNPKNHALSSMQAPRPGYLAPSSTRFSASIIQHCSLGFTRIWTDTSAAPQASSPLIFWGIVMKLIGNAWQIYGKNCQADRHQVGRGVAGYPQDAERE